MICISRHINSAMNKVLKVIEYQYTVVWPLKNPMLEGKNEADYSYLVRLHKCKYCFN